MRGLLAFVRNGRHHRARPVTVRLVTTYLALGAVTGGAIVAWVFVATTRTVAAGWCP